MALLAAWCRAGKMQCRPLRSANRGRLQRAGGGAWRDAPAPGRARCRNLVQRRATDKGRRATRGMKRVSWDRIELDNDEGAQFFPQTRKTSLDGARGAAEARGGFVEWQA